MAIRRMLLDLSMAVPMTVTTDKAPTITVSNFAIEPGCFADDESAAASVTSGLAIGGFDCAVATALPVAGIGAADIVAVDLLISEGSGQREATTDRCIGSVP